MATTHRVVYEALKRVYPNDYKYYYGNFCKAIDLALQRKIPTDDFYPKLTSKEVRKAEDIILRSFEWYESEKLLGLEADYFRDTIHDKFVYHRV